MKEDVQSGAATLQSGNDAKLEPGDPGDVSLQSGINARQEPGDPGGITLLSGGDGAKENANLDRGATGWHSRGYLPHFDGHDVLQHVTFHLADSLPKKVVERLADEIRSLPQERQDVERRKRVETWMDSGFGCCILREPFVAGMVQNALLFFDGQRYRLFAWVVMPNHVHVLFQPMNDWSVAKIVASWKKFTARKICDYQRIGSIGNANLKTNGDLGIKPVWHREYWDRFIRDERHFQQVLEYIHSNPVKAGLVARAEAWSWCSASPAHQDANPEIGVPGKKP